ncbi:MAG: hypothetical protein KKB39_02545 [Nanoarchaeota archaeon]|nr:hypothetical protein [Nanoarchaeota archaeon]
MVSLTLSVPNELKHEMDLFPEINWSAVAREAIKSKVIQLEKFKQFTKNSNFTENEALNLGKELTAKVMGRHKK